jgi:hypothetical protein
MPYLKSGRAMQEPAATRKITRRRGNRRTKRGSREHSKLDATALPTPRELPALLSNGSRLSCRPPCSDHTPTAARREAAMPARSADGRRHGGSHATNRGRSAAAVCWGGLAKSASPQLWTGVRPRPRTSSCLPAPAAPGANRRRRPFERDVMPAPGKPAPRTTNRATPALAKRAFPWR